MEIRRIKAKEKRKTNWYCSYCRPKRVHAMWRMRSRLNHKTDLACDEHLQNLKKRVEKDLNLTEADYQSWAKNLKG